MAGSESDKEGEEKVSDLTVFAINNNNNNKKKNYRYLWGVGIACWLEHRTLDRKVASSNPGRSGGENFLLQSQLCVLSLIRCPFQPHVPAVVRKRSRSFCQKCRWQVTPKHAYTLDPTKSELADCPGMVWEPIRKRAHTQLVREHSVTVVSAR